MDKFVVTCRACGQKNRVELRVGPVCGRCRQSLASDIAVALMEVADNKRKENSKDLLDEIMALTSEMEAGR